MEKALANELVRRISLGDDGAFDELYGSMSGVVYVVRVAVVWVEDAIHKTFAIVIRKSKSMEVLPDNCFAWIFGIARNVARSLPKADLCETPVDYSETDFPSDYNEDDFLDKIAVRGALQKLSVKSQQMLRLRFTEGMTFRELAEIFRTSETTMKRRMEHILKKLRLELED